MNKNLKNRKLKRTSIAMASVMIVGTMASTPITVTNVLAYNGQGNNLSTLKLLQENYQTKGWIESAGIEWKGIKGAEGYNVYYKLADNTKDQYKQIDNSLIRQYSSNFRADILGLKTGTYIAKIVPVMNGKENTSAQIVTNEFEVKEHTREGFAFSEESTMKTASGGYNDDGTVPAGAQILYITKDTVNDVTLEVITNSKGTKTKTTGLSNILSARAKGYDKTPLIIRIIGEIKADDIEGLNSNGYLQLKGLSNVTIEGVGTDATINGWGLLVRQSRNVEIRNLGIMLFPDDAISLDTGNENIWIHNNDIFYGAAGSDADQVKGDGSADVKGKSTFVTISYNHFWDSGKASLCGMSDTEEFFVTYHHNHFDRSDSRHPRIRVGTVHIYNNYFSGNSKYGVGVTKGGSAFVEANDFRNSKYPMLISQQGTDIYGGSKGTFSGEDGGMIKAFNNLISGETRLVYAQDNSKHFDAYLAKTRDEKVPSNYKTVQGANTYNNFDTSSKMYKYTPDPVENVRDIVTNYAGRTEGGDFDWTFTLADDKDSSINKELMKKIQNYKSSLIAVEGGSVIITSPEEQIPEESTKPETPTVKPETPTVKPETPNTSTVNTAEHNFTKDGINSKVFDIKGNITTSKGTVNYNGMTLRTALKLESSTCVKFTTSNETTLTLVLNSDFNKKVKIDGKEYTAKNGLLNVTLKAGSHTITKADSGNLFYIKLAGESKEDNDLTNSTVNTAAHNFTKDGINSKVFDIKGNISTSKGTVNYNDMTLRTALKLESSTCVKFTTSNETTLTLVLNSDFNKKVKIDGKEYTAKNGLLNVTLKAGSHTITKADSGNLFYIKLA